MASGREELAALRRRYEQVVEPGDPLAGYFAESLGIAERAIAGAGLAERELAGLSSPRSKGPRGAGEAGVPSDRLGEVHAVEAAHLLAFMAEELEAWAHRRGLAYAPVEVTDHGLVGDGRTNNRDAFERLIDGLRERGRPTRLIFPPGDYYFADTAGDARGSMVIADVEDLIVEGRGGARLITNGGPMAGDSVRLERCRNVGVSEITMDMAPLPFAFGQIVGRDAVASTIEVELDDDSPMPDASYFAMLEAGRGLAVSIREPGSHRYVRGAGNGLAAWQIEAIGERRYRLGLRHGQFDHIAVGARAVVHPRGRPGSGQGIRLVHCRHVLIERLRMHAAETVCLWPEFSGGVQLIDCDFVPPPGRPALVNADGIHAPRNVRGPYLERCRILGTNDDCLNFYNPVFSVADQGDSGRSLTLVVDFPGEADEFFRPGDPVGLLNGNTGEPDGVGVVESAGPTPWAADAPAEGLRHRKLALRLQLDRAMSGIVTREAVGRPRWASYNEYWQRDSPAYQAAAAIDAPHEHFAVNLRYLNSGFVIRDCRFGHNRALGFKCKAGNGVIRDSHFIDQALLLEAGLTWREGFLPHDIALSNTRIDWFCFTQLDLPGRCLKGEAAARWMPRITFEGCIIGGERADG